MADRGRGTNWREQALVSMPRRPFATPLRELGRRVLLALILLAVTTLIVYVDRASYSDNVNNDGLTLIDSLYYATITITTTGYGDLTPATQHARLINAILITPIRIMFLVLLVGTTLEVLANEGRRGMQDATWRKRMRNHTVVIGYGTKGRAAISTLRRHDVPIDKVVVIDSNPQSVHDANLDGLAAFQGDGSSRALLHRAEVSKAKQVIITLDRDDTAILTTLTVRQLNPRAHVVVSVREHENVPLLRQSGADMVVTSSEAVGRLMGLSSVNPFVGDMMEDLLTHGDGLEVVERQVTPDEVGENPCQITDERVLGVVRHDVLRRFYDPTVEKLHTGDSLVVVRKSTSQSKPRPSSHDDDF